WIGPRSCRACCSAFGPFCNVRASPWDSRTCWSRAETMRSRNVALLLSAALVVYLLLLVGRGVALVRTGETVPVLLGVGVLVLPLLGVWIIVTTWRSGNRVQRLARKLESEDGLPDLSELPRRPSG